jgi:ribosomal protein S18 acetylase RimI-like enzyme
MNKNIKIRKTTLKDLLQIKEILLNALHKDYFGAGEYYFREEFVDPNYSSLKGPYYSKEQFIKNNLKSLKERITKPYLSYVLFLKKEMVGYIIIEKHLKRYWINDFVIKKEFQDKGYGKIFFDFLIKDKKDVYIWVNKKNPAKKFWEKQGFKEVLEEVLMKR